MTVLKCTNSNHKVKFFFFIKIAAFIILIWIYPHTYDENPNSKFLIKGNKLYVAFDERPHRHLAKHEIQDEKINSSFLYKTNRNGNNYKLMNSRNNNNTYEQINRGKINCVESYLNTFKDRYYKKRGLKKLDCYYEKKLFSSFLKVEKLAKQKNISKRIIIYIIYVLPLILSFSLPFLAFAIPESIIHKCYLKKFTFTVTVDGNDQPTITKDGIITTETIDSSLRYIFLIISIPIVVSFIIYTYIKILKYKRIRLGMLK
ncbi:Plasmodium exported protein, unknown function [Plasmodium vivax]|uniref:Fam-l protein n=1 Tax=Plasmodium vivax TaxID=5855 RepID=A0A565A596_PLAVI|nr:Plasmodium exported protein, unknown function [Plasmodium vivax]